MKGMTERVHLFSKFVQKESAGRKDYLNTLIQNSTFSYTFKIQVNNLTFSYPESDKPAISNISFAINSGSTLAIIGSSGSGKTTLADCLLGLLEPTSGNIEIDKTAQRFTEQLIADLLHMFPRTLL